ncbi:MAG: hypothetical protein ACI8XO_005003 [Verrucomicrobiales bacterium]
MDGYQSVRTITTPFAHNVSTSDTHLAIATALADNELLALDKNRPVHPMGNPADRLKQVHDQSGVKPATLINQDPNGWQYSAEDRLPAENWHKPGFDSSAWKAGTTPLGYGEEDLKTKFPTKNPAGKKIMTAYFHKTFGVKSPQSIKALALEVRRDDGGAVYLNGRYVARMELPKDKPITYESLERKIGVYSCPSVIESTSPHSDSPPRFSPRFSHAAW